MRTSLLTTVWMLSLAAAPLAAQEGEAHGGGGFLSPNTGLMFWTLVIFLILLVVLSRFAFKPITAAVAAREAALQRALDEARRDREEAARLLEEHRRAIEGARAEAQRFIAEGHAAGEKIREEMLEQARREQQEILERAQQAIAAERDRAIAELRREAVDLAIRGASRVIEKNLDDQTNRRLVEEFLASASVSRGDGRGARG